MDRTAVARELIKVSKLLGGYVELEEMDEGSVDPYERERDERFRKQSFEQSLRNLQWWISRKAEEVDKAEINETVEYKGRFPYQVTDVFEFMIYAYAFGCKGKIPLPPQLIGKSEKEVALAVKKALMSSRLYRNYQFMAKKKAETFFVRPRASRVGEYTLPNYDGMEVWVKLLSGDVAQISAEDSFNFYNASDPEEPEKEL